MTFNTSFYKQEDCKLNQNGNDMVTNTTGDPIDLIIKQAERALKKARSIKSCSFIEKLLSLPLDEMIALIKSEIEDPLTPRKAMELRVGCMHVKDRISDLCLIDGYGAVSDQGFISSVETIKQVREAINKMRPDNSTEEGYIRGHVEMLDFLRDEIEILHFSHYPSKKPTFELTYEN